MMGILCTERCCGICKCCVNHWQHNGNVLLGKKKSQTQLFDFYVSATRFVSVGLLSGL